MRALTVKNIPDDLYQRLKESARANRRSVNSEVIVCIERTLRSRTADPEAVLARARQLRERTSEYTIDDQTFTAAKKEGRL